MAGDPEKEKAIIAIGEAISSTTKIIHDALGNEPDSDLLDAAIVASGTGLQACMSTFIDLLMATADDLTAEDAGKLVGTMLIAMIRKTAIEMGEPESANEYAREALRSLDAFVEPLVPDSMLEEMEKANEDED